SGGSTPAQMLRKLAQADIPWESMEIFQVDERVAPANDHDRNLTMLLESLRGAPLKPRQVHAMPVESEDLSNAAVQYANELTAYAGTPPVLDVAHLGLGADGHTASLVPGDPVLEVTNNDVALCREYMGRRRMTMTYPMLNRARQILWLVS